MIYCDYEPCSVRSHCERYRDSGVAAYPLGKEASGGRCPHYLPKTEQRYTEGPWKVGSELGNSNFIIHYDAGNRGRGIALAETRPGIGNELQNARLMAAAPELVEVLLELSWLVEGVRYGDYVPDSFTLQPVREVMAKLGIDLEAKFKEFTDGES